MPADILATDTLFPELNGKETTDQKFEMVTDYLWLLREQLTFALTNLGMANFNASQLQKLGNTLTEPFAVMLTEQDKKFAAFQVTIDGINGTISALDETFMKQTDFSVTSNGVKVTIGETTSELASVSKLNATANSLNSTISSVRSTANTAKSTADSAKSTADTVNQNYISKSSATQTASGFELEVMGTSSSGSSQTRMKMTKDGLKIYNKAGTAVFDFDTGTGDLKVTGTITGSEIYGSTFATVTNASEESYSTYIKMSSAGLSTYVSGVLSGVRIRPVVPEGFNTPCIEIINEGSVVGNIGIDGQNWLTLSSDNGGVHVYGLLHAQLSSNYVALHGADAVDISGGDYGVDEIASIIVGNDGVVRMTAPSGVYINGTKLPY